MTEQTTHTSLPTAGFALLPLSALSLNDYNARRFEENMTPQRRARFEELVDSVRTMGVFEPLLVREISTQHYEIIAGERRFRAALRVMNELLDAAGEKIDYRIPCMVHEIDADQAFDMMIIENLQREDLTPFELAISFQHYLERHGNTADAVSELAFRTGIPCHAIRRQVRLLNLPPAVLSAWETGSITQSHAEIFTRVGDAEQILELLGNTLRLKLSTREMAERIATASPDLERGFFDKTECQTCHFNTTVQSGLFADLTPGGKCSNSACFEEKQASFLTDNWSKSKPAVQFGTQGFRFGHRLSSDHREPLGSHDTADRCLGCDCFVSILRLTGAVVSNYERTCIGPVVCFDELYREKPAELPASEPAAKPEEPEQQYEPATAGKTVPNNPNPPPVPPKKSGATEPTGPVFNSQRGEKFRDAFFKEALQGKINDLPTQSAHLMRLLLTALTLSSGSVKENMAARLGLDKNAPQKDFASGIFLIPAEDLPGELRAAALAWSISADSFTMIPVRQFIAEQLGIDLSLEWTMTQNYLQSLDRSEIVRIGEETGVDIWREEKAAAYRQAKYKGKALRALKKEELISIIIDSGAELSGLVPAEVLGKKQG